MTTVTIDRKTRRAREREVLAFYGRALADARKLREEAEFARFRVGTESDDIYDLTDRLGIVQDNANAMWRSHWAAMDADVHTHDPFMDIEFARMIQGREHLSALADAIHETISNWIVEIGFVIHELREREAADRYGCVHDVTALVNEALGRTQADPETVPA